MVPAGATITDVNLQLRMSRTLAGPTTVGLHRVLKDWGEGTSNAAGQEGGGAPASTGDATWVHTFFDTQTWTTQGGDFAAATSASTVVSSIGPYNWTGAGLVDDVQRWIDDPSTNFGWELLGDESSTMSAKRFDSRETAVASNRPVLTITYTTSDQPSLTIDDATVTEGDSGTVTATFTVSLSAPSDQTVTVHYATSNGTAVAPADYTAIADTVLSFEPGENTKTVSVAVRGDTLDEPNETFQVDLSSASNATISDGQGIGTITDDDPAPSVTLALAGSPMAEAGGEATVTATLSAASGRDVTVNLGFTGTATLTDDYTRSGTSITIPAGSLSGSITLTAEQDTLVEPDETIVVDITGVTNGTESGTQRVTAEITDDDSVPSVTLALAGSPMAEAGGEATVTATLSAASGLDVTVNLGFTGTATNVTDYTRSATSITIPAGSLTGSITLTAEQDTLDEPNETIIVSITGVTNGTESGSQEVTATITDDDPAPSVTLSLADSPMAEAGGEATVTATLSALSGRAVTVNLGFTGSATNVTDYTRSGTSITIPAGSLTGSITLAAEQDTLDEPDETIVVSITGVTNGTESGTQQVTATITDDDPSPTLSVSDVSVTEGDGGTVDAVFTVSLSEASGRTVTVQFATADGTAIAPDDYTELTLTTLTFDPGQTVGTVVVAVKGDTLDEANETFTLDLSNAANATIDDGRGVGTILNDEGVPSLSIDDVSVTEGDGGTVNATFTVTLSAPSGQTVTVHYATADGTAMAPGDYTAVDDTLLSFAPGETTKTVMVTVQGDTLDEPDEAFSASLTDAVNAAIADGQGTGTIIDDDPAPGVTLSLAGSPMAEAAGVATVTATLSAASGLDVTVSLGFTGTATNVTDYTRSATSITIPAGSLTGSITLTAEQDTLDEPNETIIVSITGVTNGTESGSQEVTATITDNDPAPGVVLALSDSPMAEAAGVATVTATISTLSGRNVTINLGFTGTATNLADYTRSATSITIPAGSLSGSITLTAVQDTLDEDDDSIIVDITGVTNGTESGTQRVTAVIADDDPAPAVTLALSGSPMAEAAGAATVTATISEASGLDVTVSLGFNGTATNVTDYIRSATSIIIPAGSLTGSITLTAEQDTLDEPDETIVVSITGVTNGTESGTQQVTATITDDDSPTTPQLTGFSVQKGNSGRSFIRFVDLEFDQSSGLSALVESVDDGDPSNDRIRLISRGLDGSGATPVALAMRLNVIDRVIEADFGAGGITGNPDTNAGDGFYDFELDLDGNGEFEAARRFHRILGDVDGDQQVTDDDIDLISIALGAAGPLLGVDVDGDTAVSATDRRLARRNLGRRLGSGLSLNG
jgi:carbon monoxide dehydrogenase subunit G